MTKLQVNSKINSNNSNNSNGNISNNKVNDKINNFVENNNSSTEVFVVESLKETSSEINNPNLSKSSITKSAKVNRFTRKKLPRNGEILLIDLTNSVPSVVSKIQKPLWLQNFEKQKAAKGTSPSKISSLKITLQKRLEDTFKLLTIRKDDVPVKENCPETLLKDKEDINIEDMTTTIKTMSTTPKIDDSECSTMEIDDNPSSQKIANDSSPEAVLEIFQTAKHESHSSNKITEIFPVAESQCNVKSASASSLDNTFKTDVDTACMKMDYADYSSLTVGEKSEIQVAAEMTKQNELNKDSTEPLEETAAKKANDQSNIDQPLIFTENKPEEPRDYQDVRYPIQDSEIIDGLTLLACVSQKVAPIKIDSSSNNLIKVKDYSALKKADAENAAALSVTKRSETVNEILNICPEATLEIEVSSSNENANYVDRNDMQNNLDISTENPDVILNGETIVLLRKKNSNLYIINKADLVAREELLPEHTKSLELMKMEMENEDVKSNLENLKKCKSYTCRQEIKHDYRVANYGLQKYPAMHNLVDPQLPLTLPTIYPNFSTSSELCMSCQKHCNSMSCGMNPQKTNNSRCGPCSTCACEVVAHCRQCILPANESHPTFIENNSYYIPAQANVISRTNGDVMMMDLYENQLLRKIENEILDGKPLEEVDMNYKTEMKRHTERASKLPLKKRLKAHMMSLSYSDLNIKMSNEFLVTSISSTKHVNEPSVQNIIKPTEVEIPVKGKSAKSSSTVTKEKSSKVDYSYLKQDYEWNPPKVQYKDSTYRKLGTTNAYTSCDEVNKTPVQKKTLKESSKDADWKNTSAGKKEVAQEKPVIRNRRSERASKRKVPKVIYNYPEYSEIERYSTNTKRRRKIRR